MSKKIGEALVERGIISGDQLGTALQAQNSRGGKLGVNLLELGMIGERDLGQMLGELLRTQYAPPEVLEEVGGAVLDELPRELVEKHRAIPLRREDKTLHLLVPSLQNLSGLSRVTGLRVIPWIAPEVRLTRELERHYDIPMDPRSSAIIERLESPDIPEPEPAAVVDRPERPTPAAESYGYGRSWRDVAQEIEVDEALSLGQRFCAVDNSGEAVSLLLDHAAQDMVNCVLFRVADDVARIWGDRSSFIDRHSRATVSMSVASGSMLELLAVRPYYRGPVPQDEAYRVFFTLTGLPVPQEIVLVPIRVANRLIGVLYGDGGVGGGINGVVSDHLELVRRFTLALTLVVIKNKILK